MSVSSAFIVVATALFFADVVRGPDVQIPLDLAGLDWLVRVLMVLAAIALLTLR